MKKYISILLDWTVIIMLSIVIILTAVLVLALAVDLFSWLFKSGDAVYTWINEDSGSEILKRFNLFSLALNDISAAFIPITIIALPAFLVMWINTKTLKNYQTTEIQINLDKHSILILMAEIATIILISILAVTIVCKLGLLLSNLLGWLFGNEDYFRFSDEKYKLLTVVIYSVLRYVVVLVTSLIVTSVCIFLKSKSLVNLDEMNIDYVNMTGNSSALNK